MLNFNGKICGLNTFLNPNFFSNFIFAKCDYNYYLLSISLNPYDDIKQKLKISLPEVNCINELKTNGNVINKSLEQRHSLLKPFLISV